jgi:hypothetical protein
MEKLCRCLASLLMFQHLLLYAFFYIKLLQIMLIRLCLIALTVLLVLSMMDLVDFFWIGFGWLQQWNGYQLCLRCFCHFFHLPSNSRITIKYWSKISKRKKVNGKLTVLIEKGGVCLFKKNLREVCVSFKTKGGVPVILVNLKGGECNFPYI